MVFQQVVGNIYNQIASDPGVVTYLEGPECGDANPHWAVRSAASIALLFKIGAIGLAALSVVLLSYLGIMMSWGLAFGLPWTLAYFYFIWICPSHQLSMGIRKLKPYRMLWWVAATAVHIILILGILASYTTFSTSYLHIDDAKLVKPVVFLSVILAILTLFEILVIYAIFLIKAEKQKLDSESSAFFMSLSPSSMSARSSSTPPPSYADSASSPSKPPPKYEEVCEESNKMFNVPTQSSTQFQSRQNV